jgi:hypothetical protein
MMLAEEAFVSVRAIAWKTLIPRTTCHCNQVEWPSITTRHFPPVAHRLSLQKKCTQVQKAQELKRREFQC